MPCKPLNSNTITPPSFPVGFPSGFAPQLPDLNVPIPLPIEDLQAIFNTLSMILPPGTLKPHLSANYSKDILDGVLSILEMFVPYLMIYTAFMPILNMILCIIEVLCSIANPIKLIRALSRLFRSCIPEFLAMFPAFAFIIIIISLLLLILALVIYLIERILGILETILKNIKTISMAAQRLDNDSILAITSKIGDLLCQLQNLFALFGVLLIIIQVIEALLKLGFKLPPCDDSDGSNDGCCTPDVCPSFIKDNRTITFSTGTLQYLNEAAVDSGLILPAAFGILKADKRKESWQFFDVSLSTDLAFDNITHPFDEPLSLFLPIVFFPSGVSYTATTPISSVPYTIDLRLFYVPAIFGRADFRGSRFLRINNCIVTSPPTDGVLDYNNQLVFPFNGTLNLIGGLVFEDDGTTSFSINGQNQANLNDLVHLNSIVSSNPPLNPTDGYTFQNIEYTFKINHDVLFAHNLITAGCHPDVAANKNVINTTLAVPLLLNAQKLQAVKLPDIAATTQCISSAVTQFRQGISEESLQTFQDTIIGCLNSLKDDTSAALSSVIKIGFDQFKSDFTIDPSIQFTTRPIKVSVTLAEGTGKNMATNLPNNIADELITHFSAQVTLGLIDKFLYDGKTQFTANITSNKAGNGTVQVLFDGKPISILNNPANVDQTPSVQTKILPYTFVLSSTLVGEEQPRRAEDDIARDGVGSDGGE